MTSLLGAGGGVNIGGGDIDGGDVLSCAVSRLPWVANSGTALGGLVENDDWLRKLDDDDRRDSDGRRILSRTARNTAGV